jgi:hypothetical protein
MDDEHVDKHNDAESQREERELLDLQAVFARVGFAFHGL